MQTESLVTARNQKYLDENLGLNNNPNEIKAVIHLHL